MKLMKSPPILIVDSDPRDLAKHAAILTEARYTVMQAAGYPEALAILARHRGKLVVLSDLSIGGESGLKFLDDDVLLPKFDQGQGSINPVFIAPDQPVWVIKRTEILPKIKL